MLLNDRRKARQLARKGLHFRSAVVNFESNRRHLVTPEVNWVLLEGLWLACKMERIVRAFAPVINSLRHIELSHAPVAPLPS